MPSTAPIKVPIVGVDKYSKAFKGLTKKAAKMGRAMSTVGQQMTTRLTLPILGIGAGAVKMSVDMNKAMANVGSLIPKQTERLKKMKSEVMDLGVQMGTSSTVIAEGLYETISAFGATESPMQKLTISTKMAKAGLATVKESLGLVSAVTKGYGDTSDAAAQKVSDLSFLTVKLGQTTFPELAASMGRVVPLASTLKVSQEELFGTMATLTGVTGTASEVSTQLASVLGAMVKPSEAMTSAAQDLGFASSTAMVEELGLAESLKLLGEYTDGDTQKLGKLITRKEGLIAALALTGGQADTYNEKLLAMSDAAGSTDAAFKAQTEGINKAGFGFEQMLERIKRLSVKIGDQLLPLIEKVVIKLEPFIDSFSDASAETIMLGIKIAGAVAAIGPIILIIGKVTAAVTWLVSAIGSAGGLSGVLAFITGPVGIAIAAITAFIAVIAYCWDEIAILREAIAGPFLTLFSELKNIFSGVGESGAAFGSSIRDIVSAIAFLTAPIAKMAAFLYVLPLRFVIRGIRVLIQVLRIVGAVFRIVVLSIKIAWYWLGAIVKRWMEATTFGRAFAIVLNFIGKAVQNVWGFIMGMWDAVEGFFSSIADWLDSIGVKMENAAQKQKKIRDGKLNYKKRPDNDSSMNDLDAQLVKDMKLMQESQSNITIDFEGLPGGAKPKIKKQKGANVKVGKKGAVMEGAL